VDEEAEALLDFLNLFLDNRRPHLPYLAMTGLKGGTAEQPRALNVVSC